MIMITIYNTRFASGNTTAAELHVKNFDELCDKINPPNMDPGVLRVNLFPHSLLGLARTWYESIPENEKKNYGLI
jgi:hypothetical protein